MVFTKWADDKNRATVPQNPRNFYQLVQRHRWVHMHICSLRTYILYGSIHMIFGKRKMIETQTDHWLNKNRRKTEIIKYIFHFRRVLGLQRKCEENAMTSHRLHSQFSLQWISHFIFVCVYVKFVRIHKILLIWFKILLVLAGYKQWCMPVSLCVGG